MNPVETSFNPSKGFYDPNQLFTDGGIAGANTRGKVKAGTWACCLVKGVEVLKTWSGVVLPEDYPDCEISNNVTELMALVQGLTLLPWDWRGTIWSDSKITLGRVFLGWHVTNIPGDLLNSLENQKARLVHWDQIHYGLVDGHPTQDQLSSGFGKRGHPVSKFNAMCDRACKRQSDVFLRKEKEQKQLQIENQVIERSK
jgi:ribonuclease HI